MKGNLKSKVTVNVPKNIALHYANITGDYNIHHLPFLAKFVGYKGPIAHGLWTLSRCIAEIYKNGDIPIYPYKCNVAFKVPLYTPSSAQFSYHKNPKTGEIFFRLYNEDETAPHIIANLISAK